MEKLIKEATESLKRNTELLTVIAKSLLQATMREEFRNEKFRKLYELTGTSTVKQISEKTGISVGVISETWQKWETLGLLVKDGKNYRRSI